MSLWNDPLVSFITAVEATNQPLPPEATELLARWESRESHPTAQHLYTQALLGGDDTNLPVLHAGALAEASAMSTHRATVDNIVGMELLARLRAIIIPAAPQWHTNLAKQLSAHWAEFCKAADVISPATNPADLVGSDQKTRSNWLNAELASEQLDAVANQIRNVAMLLGAGDTNESFIPLIINTTGVSRRTVWESFNADGRCHRWTAFHANSIPVMARPLDTIEENIYRQPMPLQEKLVRNGTGWQRTMIDPELEATNA